MLICCHYPLGDKTPFLWITYQTFDHDSWLVFQGQASAIEEINIWFTLLNDNYVVDKNIFFQNCRICSNDEAKGFQLLYGTKSWTNYKNIFEIFQEYFDIPTSIIVKDGQLNLKLRQKFEPIFNKCRYIFKNDEYENFTENVRDIFNQIGLTLVPDFLDYDNIDFLPSISEKYSGTVLLLKNCSEWPEESLSMFIQKYQILVKLNLYQVSIQTELQYIVNHLNTSDSLKFISLLENKEVTISDDLAELHAHKKPNNLTCEHMTILKNYTFPKRPYFMLCIHSNLDTCDWQLSYVCPACFD